MQYINKLLELHTPFVFKAFNFNYKYKNQAEPLY